MLNSDLPFPYIAPPIFCIQQFTKFDDWEYAYIYNYYHKPLRFVLMLIFLSLLWPVWSKTRIYLLNLA